jgi:hypothetical protein
VRSKKARAHVGCQGGAARQASHQQQVLGRAWGGARGGGAPELGGELSGDSTMLWLRAHAHVRASQEPPITSSCGVRLTTACYCPRSSGKAS